LKTIHELYKEIMASKELKDQFIESAKAGKQEAFLKEHGCEATLDEVKAFLEAKQNADAPLSLDEMENAAGSGCDKGAGKDVAMSVILLGVGCVVAVIASASATVAGTGYVGYEKKKDMNLCNLN